MPTLVKTFNFTSSAEGWLFSSSGNLTQSWDSIKEALTATYAYMFPGGNSGSTYWSGTWADLDVPANCIVTHIQLTSISTKKTSTPSGLTGTIGALTLNTSTTVWSGRTLVPGTDSSYVTSSGSNTAVPAGIQARNSNITLRLNHNTGVQGSGNASFDVDAIEFTITYVSNVYTGGATLQVNRALGAGGTEAEPKFTGGGNLAVKAQLGRYDNTNLVVHLRANESSGTTAFDSSGKGADGTLEAGVQFSSQSPNVYHRESPNSLDFFGGSGSNRRVTIPNSALSSLTTEGTFACWVKLNQATPSSNTNTGLVHLAGDSISPFPDTHYPWTDGKMYTTIFRNNRIDEITLSASVDRSQWHHLCVTSKPGTNGYIIYQNGVQVYSGTGQATVGKPSASQFSIGARTTGYGLNGQMDDVRVYNRALTPAEVMLLATGHELTASNSNRLMNGGEGGFAKEISHPVLKATGSFTMPYVAYTGGGNLQTQHPILTAYSREHKQIPLSITGHSAVLSFDPGKLSKPLKVWLNSDGMPSVSSGSDIDTWTDVYNNYSFTNTNPAYKPKRYDNVIDKWPTIRFSGSDFLSRSNMYMNNNSGVTVFVVGKNLSASEVPMVTFDNMWSVKTNGFSYVPTTNIPYTLDVAGCFGSHIVGVRQNSNRNYITDNGTIKSNATTTTITSSANQILYIGADWRTGPASFLNGDIAEILVFDGALTDGEYLQVSEYLSNKYCLAGNAQPEMPLYLEAYSWRPENRSLPLYTSTGDLVNKPNGLNLSLKAPAIPSTFVQTGSGGQPSNPALFTMGSEGANSLKTAPLYVFGGANFSENNDLNLFLQANTLGSINDLARIPILNLYTAGAIDGLQLEYTGYGLNVRPTPSLNMSIRGIGAFTYEQTAPLFVKGLGSEVDKSLNLYLEQKNALNNLSLFLQAPTTGGGFSDFTAVTHLSIRGRDLMNSNIPMTVYLGTAIARQTTLFIKAPTPVNKNTTMYIQGPIPSNGDMNLFLKVVNPTLFSSTFPMSVMGSALAQNNAVSFGLAPLFLRGGTGAGKLLNLFLNGDVGTVDFSRNLNLFLKSGPPISYNSVPLFLSQNSQELAEILELYIRGLGKNPGYYPSYQDVNLYVDGTGSGPFASPMPKNASANLVINGQFIPINDDFGIINMYVAAPGGISVNDDITTFIAGAVPPSINANIPLVIPKTKLLKTTNLYIHGF